MKTDENNITVRFLPHKFLPKESQKKIWYASGQKYFFFGSCVDFNSFWKKQNIKKGWTQNTIVNRPLHTFLSVIVKKVKYLSTIVFVLKNRMVFEILWD